MEKQLIINSSDEMILFGQRLGSLLKANSIVGLEGDLGAGKTTLCKGIAKGMGITSLVNSPTFTIMKIYEGDLNLYHLDVYRLKQASDDFELEEYFDAGGIAVIEWAKNIKKLLPEEMLWITIDIINDSQRKLTLTSQGEYYTSIVKKVIK